MHSFRSYRKRFSELGQELGVKVIDILPDLLSEHQGGSSTDAIRS